VHAVSEHRSLSQSNLHVCDWSQRAKTTWHVTAANSEKMVLLKRHQGGYVTHLTKRNIFRSIPLFTVNYRSYRTITVASATSYSCHAPRSIE